MRHLHILTRKHTFIDMQSHTTFSLSPSLIFQFLLWKPNLKALKWTESNCTASSTHDFELIWLLRELRMEISVFLNLIYFSIAIILVQRCPTWKWHSPQMWGLRRYCRHTWKKLMLQYNILADEAPSVLILSKKL